MVFEDFPMYCVTKNNRDLEYHCNTNGISNVIYFHSTTQVILKNFDSALKVCL